MVLMVLMVLWFDLRSFVSVRVRVLMRVPMFASSVCGGGGAVHQDFAAGLLATVDAVIVPGCV